VYGKPCPGYTDQFHFRYSHGKSNIDDKVREAVPLPASKPGLQPQRRKTKDSISRRSSTAQPDSNVSLIATSISPTHEDISLCYFVSRFVSPNGMDGFPGHLSFLTRLFDHHRHGLMELATLTVAQMAAYNQFRDEGLRLESYRNYGRTIKSLQKAIHCDEEVKDDRVIATVLLLCILKVSTHSRSFVCQNPGCYETNHL
jgi:hypothetical protein